MKAKHRVTRVFVILFLVIIGVLASIHLWHARTSVANPRAAVSGEKSRSAVPVQVAKVNTENLPQFLSALGTVNASAIVTVRSRVEGQLMSLNFREGQDVSAGQLLAQIDPRPFQVSLLQAQGQLAKDQASLNNARADLQRYQQLSARGLVAKQQLDNQKALVAESEGALKSDQAAIDSAKLNLTYSRITAPISGRVGLKQVDAGNYISSADSNGIVVITQTHPADVIFTVPEGSIETILQAQQQGTPLVAEAWDRTDNHLLASGKLLSLDNQIDATTGTLKLKAQFTNENGLLFPNQFVNIRLQTGTLSNALTIPLAALQTSSEGAFVWQVDADNRVRRQPVTPGVQIGRLQVITAGLTAGEQVVTDGIDRLTQGSRVEVISPQTLTEENAGELSQ